MRILLAEDDENLADAIASALALQEYRVQQVATGADADQALQQRQFDLLILDLELPKFDGFEVLSRLRGRHQQLPVLIVSERNGVQDKVSGLDKGANDYMTKPFDLAELEARVRALLRKEAWANQTSIELADLTYDTVSRSVVCNNVALDLSARELAVLEVLLQNKCRVVAKQRLLDHLYHWEDDVSANALETVIHRLRKKLEVTSTTVRTVRNLGYLIEERQ